MNIVEMKITFSLIMKFIMQLKIAMGLLNNNANAYKLINMY